MFMSRLPFDCVMKALEVDILHFSDIIWTRLVCVCVVQPIYRFFQVKVFLNNLLIPPTNGGQSSVSSNSSTRANT